MIEQVKNHQNTNIKKTLSTGERLAIARKEAIKRGVVFGRKIGVKLPKTLAKEAIQKEVNQQIMLKAVDIVKATMLPALGMNFVYRIDEVVNEKGKVTERKHVLVEDPKEIAKALDEMEAGGTHPDDAYYYVTTKAPEYKAGESLLNRLLGKPKESLSVDVDVKFSLKDLGKKADTLEQTKYKDASFTEVNNTVVDSTTQENVQPDAI